MNDPHSHRERSPHRVAAAETSTAVLGSGDSIAPSDQLTSTQSRIGTSMTSAAAGSSSSLGAADVATFFSKFNDMASTMQLLAQQLHVQQQQQMQQQ